VCWMCVYALAIPRCASLWGLKQQLWINIAEVDTGSLHGAHGGNRTGTTAIPQTCDTALFYPTACLTQRYMNQHVTCYNVLKNTHHFGLGLEGQRRLQLSRHSFTPQHV
jgi:hypothetical protein